MHALVSVRDRTGLWIFVFDCIAHDTPSRRKKSELVEDGDNRTDTYGIEETGEAPRFEDRFLSPHFAALQHSICRLLCIFFVCRRQLRAHAISDIFSPLSMHTALRPHCL